MLQLKDIKKDYVVADTTVNALRGLTLDFRKCEYVSILGPSGCGKTTLMNVIGGLDKATSGDIVINGKSTKSYADADWDNFRNKKIGFVFQNYNLIMHLNVISNVELALTLSGISAEERKLRAKTVLEEVGLGDQLYKKPNQLSGGQMQRVAIARALVNSPEIVLADEPTGALDTKTSEQILDLLREIAKDKLVVMVTHNSELAEKYSTRIIKMLDGVITEDSNPYDSTYDTSFKNEVAQIEATEKILCKKENKKNAKKQRNKTSMGFITALSLSIRNLFTKKLRTILTAVAGSIGIIGVALILSVSNGMNLYIEKMQRDTLATYPITVATSSFDLSAAMEVVRGEIDMPTLPKAQEIYAREIQNTQNLLNQNNITEKYVQFVKDNVKSEWVNDITYKTGLELSVYGQLHFKGNKNASGELTDKDYYKVLNTSSSSNLITGSSSSSWQMLLNTDFLSTQYDVIAGEMATEVDQAVIIVDEYNRISDNTLKYLYLKSESESTKVFSFDDILDPTGDGQTKLTFKVLTNSQAFIKVNDDKVPGYDPSKPVWDINGKYNKENPAPHGISAAGIPTGEYQDVKIVGIIRVNETTDFGAMSEGIGYTKQLYEWLQTKNQYNKTSVSPNAEISKWMDDNMNAATVAASVAIDDELFIKNITIDDTQKLALMALIIKANAGGTAIPEDFANAGIDVEDIDDLIAVANEAFSSTLKHPYLPDGYVSSYGGFLDALQKISMQESVFRALGGNSVPNEINIYPMDFESKDLIKTALNKWNDDNFDQINYTDPSDLVGKMMKSMVDVISYVLIAFTSISLIVSSVMIGILTYVSVLERTKEIGILRSIGARKKDISRVFNAETFTIGLAAGLFGVIVAYILTIPINAIIKSLAGVAGIANLAILAALALVGISVVLTLISGFIPAKIAARKDPVTALRSE